MLRNVRSCNSLLVRCYSKATGAAKPPTGSPAIATTPNVTGLSSNCVKPTTSPVGFMGASADNPNYKVPEYFSFNRFSYHEAEVEMAKYRCPQPSALKK
ncbi:NADH:ubiquinone oxidoreductase subunit V3 [Musca autumnalis]|uniref:NADH:ubiquinone oxidoreductase subunit V3 n=1 Tax=Musca autumnalis TaxID=221902 RepID=UPI003CEC1303